MTGFFLPTRDSPATIRSTKLIVIIPSSKHQQRGHSPAYYSETVLITSIIGTVEISQKSITTRIEEHKKDCKVLAMTYSATSDDQLPSDRTDRILVHQQRGMTYSSKGRSGAAEDDF